MSKSDLHLTPFTFIIAAEYITFVSVVTSISSDLLSANLSHIDSHIDLWCLFLHCKQALALRHFAALCLAPVQLKQISTLNHAFCSYTIRRSMVIFLTVHTLILSLVSLVTFTTPITFFWISFITQWHRISHSALL